MAATMPSAVLWARERSTTSKPCTAMVSAMPEPMIPEPTIPTRLIDMGRMLPAGYLDGPSERSGRALNRPAPLRRARRMKRGPLSMIRRGESR